MLLYDVFFFKMFTPEQLETFFSRLIRCCLQPGNDWVLDPGTFQQESLALCYDLESTHYLNLHPLDEYLVFLLYNIDIVN